MNSEKKTDAEERPLVMRWRCGWCGTPTRENGEPMAMSEIGLTKDLILWKDAKPVDGRCCIDKWDHELEMQTLYGA